MIRVGSGVDVHAFGDDDARPLVLGGVVVPGAPGLAAHSDGDVVLHALASAVLGAAGLGDLGSVVGTDHPRHAGVASTVFLRAAADAAAVEGWRVSSVDCTIVAQRPRLAVHREAMAAVVADLLGLPGGAASVKITSTDGLGSIGRGEGIACWATAVLTLASSETDQLHSDARESAAMRGPNGVASGAVVSKQP